MNLRRALVGGSKAIGPQAIDLRNSSRQNKMAWVWFLGLQFWLSIAIELILPKEISTIMNHVTQSPIRVWINWVLMSSCTFNIMASDAWSQGECQKSQISGKWIPWESIQNQFGSLIDIPLESIYCWIPSSWISHLRSAWTQTSKKIMMLEVLIDVMVNGDLKYWI